MDANAIAKLKAKQIVEDSFEAARNETLKLERSIRVPGGSAILKIVVKTADDVTKKVVSKLIEAYVDSLGENIDVPSASPLIASALDDFYAKYKSFTKPAFDQLTFKTVVQQAVARMDKAVEDQKSTINEKLEIAIFDFRKKNQPTFPPTPSANKKSVKNGIGGKRKKLPTKLAKLIFQESNSRCPKCGESNVVCLDIHHIKRLSDGGTDDASNLIVLCKNCHGKVTSCEILRDEIVTIKKNLSQTVQRISA